MFQPVTKKLVYLVRHGESEHNFAPIFQAADAQLSNRGIEQAEIIAARMATVDFDTLVSSHLMRAQQTAEAIALKTGKTIEVNELFRERIIPTSLQGKPYANSTAWEVFKKWELSHYDRGPRVEDGETFTDIYDRAASALAWLGQHSAERITVVTHGNFMRFMVMRVLLGSRCSGDQAEYFMHHSAAHNTGVTVLKLTNIYEQQDMYEWRLATLNDFAHFAE